LIGDEVDLRYRQNQPAAGAAATFSERSADLDLEVRLGQRMRTRRSWLGVQLPVEDLAGQTLGQGFELFVERWLVGMLHGCSLFDGLERVKNVRKVSI
jgi:hypothetical protein